jgi:hypothetical protein
MYRKLLELPHPSVSKSTAQKNGGSEKIAGGFCIEANCRRQAAEAFIGCADP